jgi:hypothetical protein
MGGAIISAALARSMSVAEVSFYREFGREAFTSRCSRAGRPCATTARSRS